MSEDTVVAPSQPGQIDDPLTDVLREGARRLLAQGIEAEVEAARKRASWSKTSSGSIQPRIDGVEQMSR